MPKKRKTTKRKSKRAATKRRKSAPGFARFGCTFKVNVAGEESVFGIASMAKAMKVAKDRSKSKNGRPGPVTSIEFECAQPLVARCLEGFCKTYKASAGRKRGGGRGRKTSTGPSYSEMVEAFVEGG